MDTGTYLKVGNFIAFRGVDEHGWRVSRMTAHADASFTLTLVGQFDHTWQVREFVEANPDAGK